MRFDVSEKYIYISATTREDGIRKFLKLTFWLVGLIESQLSVQF